MQTITSPEPRLAPPLAGDYDLEVFYDADCPLCQREISMLRRWDRQRRLRFTDISDPNFEAEAYGRTWNDFMAEIHGRLPDGRWVTGVDVFRILYTAVGWGWLVSPTRLPGISHVLNWCYHLFARNRLKLTGRCGSECTIPRRDHA